MKKLALGGFLVALLAGSAFSDDDFRRERKPRDSQAAAKDAAEGKAPPRLSVSGWMNSEALKLADLKGKVVLLKFWGTW